MTAIVLDFRKPTRYCGLKRHDDRGCWKRLTCQKCGHKERPSGKCLHVCPACGEAHESKQCPMEEFYNLSASGTCRPSMLVYFRPRRKRCKLGRSPVWNLARAERSRLCIYAFVETKRIDQGSNSRIGLIANTCDLDNYRLRTVSSVKRVNEHS